MVENHTPFMALPLSHPSLRGVRPMTVLHCGPTRSSAVMPTVQPSRHACPTIWLNHGLSLDGKALRPAQVTWMNDDQLRFILREGKKRQIRRMCELVGLRVLGLKRVRIGKVALGELPAGKWRLLGAHEGFA